MEQVYEERKDCCGCSACSAVCPQNAIEMIRDEYGFWYPQIRQEKCIDCGLCSKICGFQKKEKSKSAEPIVYAAVNKNDKRRMSSSSGGMFIELAHAVIKKDGCVYGAEFDEEFNVVHERETGFQGCMALQGSKYVQSNMNDCYRRIQKDLLDGKIVLFVGVPCQVGGLKTFLQKDYENLYLIDLACHGVASPRVWSSYKEKLSQGRKIKSVSFRDKSNGWKKFSLKVEFESDSYIANQDIDPYLTLFLEKLIVRESCFHCPYNSYFRQGDITLGDFWGIEACKPYLDDNKGTSVLLVNSEKGRLLFESIKDNIIYEKSNTKECLQGPFESCMTPNPKTQKFWEDFNRDKYKAIEKYGKVSVKRIVIVRCIIPVLRKVGLYKFVMNLVMRKGKAD